MPTSRELFIYDILLDIKSKFVTREKKIRGDIIKKSFDELEILGRSLKEAIIEHIERHDIKLDDVHYYTLKDIENLLAMTFGNDAARLIVLRLKRGIKTTT